MRFGRRTDSAADGNVWLIAGLGNPGPEYERTRHNVGFRVLDILAARAGSAFKRGKHQALVAEVRRGDVRMVLAKPQTYMNLSGQSIGPMAKYFKVSPDHVVIVHDEIDLTFGELRLKVGGGTAGHNGLRSLVSSLGTPEFIRLRIGVGRPTGRKEAADHVLNAFTKAEEKEIEILVQEAADAVESILDNGFERAQNAINTRA